MAAVKVPAWPKGVAGNVWANQLADQSSYWIESDLINFDTGTAATIFAIPEDSIILSIGLEVVTALTATAGADQLVVLDTGSSGTLARFGIGQVLETGFVIQPVLKRYSKLGGVNAPGNQSRPIQTTPPSSATAGTYRVWLNIKPNRRSMRKFQQ